MTYLSCEDIDNIIVSYLFNENNKWNSKTLKKIYYSFGKSNYKSFLVICRRQFFDITYINYGSTNDIHNLLTKLIKSKHPEFRWCYQKFNRNLNSNRITLKNEYVKNDRKIIHYLSFYYGYLCLHTQVTQLEHMGNTYDKVLYDDTTLEYTTTPLSYRFLRSKRVHNLKYYDLVEKGKTIWENTYVKKSGVSVYKKGVTYDIVDLECIRIM